MGKFPKHPARRTHYSAKQTANTRKKRQVKRPKKTGNKKDQE